MARESFDGILFSIEDCRLDGAVLGLFGRYGLRTGFSGSSKSPGKCREASVGRIRLCCFSKTGSFWASFRVWGLKGRFQSSGGFVL